MKKGLKIGLIGFTVILAAGIWMRSGMFLISELEM